jgi:sugar porter (SP) family MFS transporter
MAKASTYNFVVVFFAALGSLTYAYCNSVIGSVLGLPGFISYFHLETKGPSADVAYANRITGATTGVLYAGGALGALTLWVADRLGRLRAIQIACTICVVGGAISGGSVHIGMFLVGRLLTGFSCGMLVALVPVYQAEVAPPQIRGRMGGSHGAFIGTGYALAAWVGYGCYFSKNSSFQWRFELASQCVSPLILFVGSFWLPESPRWLIARDRNDEALEILKRLTADPEDPQCLVAKEEFLQIRAQVIEDERMAVGNWDLFNRKPNRKRLFCGFFTQAIAQSAGPLVVTNYITILFSGLGLTGPMPLLMYGVFEINATIWNWIGSFIMDRAGRVRLMIIGLLGASVCYGAEAGIVAVYAGGPNRVANGFGVFFIFLFSTIYSVTLDPVTYVYSCEVFPTYLRAKGMGFSMCGQFLFALLFTEVAPTAFAAVGWK